jgi:hypothetical protein
VAGVGDTDRKISAGDFAAGGARVYFLGAVPFEPNAEVEIGDDLGGCLVSDLRRVADVVVMRVGERNMRRVARGCAKMRGEIWVAGQGRIILSPVSTRKAEWPSQVIFTGFSGFARALAHGSAL